MDCQMVRSCGRVSTTTTDINKVTIQCIRGPRESSKVSEILCNKLQVYETCYKTFFRLGFQGYHDPPERFKIRPTFPRLPGLARSGGMKVRDLATVSVCEF